MKVLTDEEKEFREWWKTLPLSAHDSSYTCSHLAWFEKDKRDRAKIEKLKEGIKEFMDENIPFEKLQKLLEEV